MPLPHLAAEMRMHTVLSLLGGQSGVYVSTTGLVFAMDCANCEATDSRSCYVTPVSRFLVAGRSSPDGAFQMLDDIDVPEALQVT